MRVHVKFFDAESSGQVLEAWDNAEKWVHVGEEVLINYGKPYKVVRVVHSGQFYISCYCEAVA